MGLFVFPKLSRSEIENQQLKGRQTVVGVASRDQQRALQWPVVGRSTPGLASQACSAACFLKTWVASWATGLQRGTQRGKCISVPKGMRVPV